MNVKCSYVVFFAWCAALVLSQGANATPVVHVVAHSHCDAGYRKSFDEYWTSSVHSIIDSVLDALSQDTDKRFVWEEVSFLSTWWKQASNASRELMKKLHSSGQLEFIGGGWVMHDEADPSLYGILNQMYLGLSFLRDTFSTRPTVEWHIDPFGHSLFMPELYSLLGYKAVVINRIPDEMKQSMRAEKGLEFYWKYAHSKHSIFTHVLDTHYGTPLLIGLNVKTLVSELVPILKKRLDWFKTDQLLFPFGGDFNFKVAGVEFTRMDAIIEYINANSSTYNMTMRYSTLSEYFNAIRTSDASYDIRSNDFFPYVPCHPCGAPQCENLPCEDQAQSSAYWSGFYSSKPAQKLLVRRHEAILKSLEVLSAFNQAEMFGTTLELGRNTSALLQHHDAITGTGFPPAFDDYNKRLNYAMDVNDRDTALYKASIMCRLSPYLPLYTDSLSTLAYLDEKVMAAAIIQNPLPVQRSSYITIQLPTGLCVEVYDSNQKVTPSQQVSSVLFFPVNLPPMGMELVFLGKKDCGKVDRPSETSALAGFSLSNGVLSLNFDFSNHLTNWSSQSPSAKVAMETHPLSQAYYRYDEVIKQTSSATDGANVYTFDPVATSQEPTKLTPEVIPTTVTASGPHIWEVKQKVNDFINATIRLYAPISDRDGVGDDTQHSSFAQWQTIIGPLPESPAMSVSSRFTSSDLNTETFQFTTYTNGFYPVVRQYNSSLPVQANTYPLVGRTLARPAQFDHTPNERSDVLAVVVERPMALTGSNGSLEMVLHRRLKKKQDPRGDDFTVMNDSLLIGFLGEEVASAASARMMSLFQTPPTVHFALLSGQPSNIRGVWSSRCGNTFQWAPSNGGLPQGIEIVDLRRLPATSSGKHRIGLHIIYTDEHAPGPCTLDITALFKNLTMTSVVEATPDFLEIPRGNFYADLRDDGNRQHSGYEKNTGKTKAYAKERENVSGFERVNVDKFLIELYPLQLKTLVLTVE